MLSFQTVHNKRRRDDDSDSDDEPYLKRSRQWIAQDDRGPTKLTSLPPFAFQPSASLSPPYVVPGLDATTPAPSDHSEANSPASIDEDLPAFSSPYHGMDYAMHMDEDDLDMSTSQPSECAVLATSFRPAKLNAELFNKQEPVVSHTGRIPTPIYPNFQSGRPQGLGYPGSGMAGGIVASSGFLGPPSNQPLTMLPPPRKQGMSFDDDRSRRIPSPISEDEDLPDTPTAFTQSQLSRLSVTNDPMDADVDVPSSGLSAAASRGRKRSGALTGIPRFSMGYRDDCEKCRLRVPGHYSHFL